MKFKEKVNIQIRIDVFLKEFLLLTRTQICNIIKNNYVLVNDKNINKCNYLLIPGNYTFFIKDEYLQKYKKTELQFNDLDKSKIEIIFENDDFAIIEKPDNLSMYRTENTKINEPTLSDYLKLIFNDLVKINENRFGIVHRLDKNTTGLLIIAKTEDFYNSIKKQFKDRTVIKKYFGIITPPLNESKLKIILPVGRNIKNRKLMTVTDKNSKQAITYLKVLETKGNKQLVEFDLKTGRTHQIRVHMKYLNSPIYNDPDYGKKATNERTGQFLHSYYLSFNDQNNKNYEFTSDKVFKLD